MKMNNLKSFEQFNEGFKDKLKKSFKKGTRVKYLNKEGEYNYGTYIRDTILRGEYSLPSLLVGALSIINDDKLGRIKIEKEKLELEEEPYHRTHSTYFGGDSEPFPRWP